MTPQRHPWWQRMRWLGSITDSRDMNLSKLWETVEDRGPGVLQSMGSQRVGHEWVTEHQQQRFHAFEYVTFPGKRDFAGMIKVKSFAMGRLFWIFQVGPGKIPWVVTIQELALAVENQKDSSMIRIQGSWKLGGHVWEPNRGFLQVTVVPSWQPANRCRSQSYSQVELKGQGSDSPQRLQERTESGPTQDLWPADL